MKYAGKADPSEGHGEYDALFVGQPDAGTIKDYRLITIPVDGRDDELCRPLIRSGDRTQLKGDVDGALFLFCP